MRKVAMAAAMAAAALSWAQVARAEDAAQKRKEAASATREEMKEEGRDAKKDVQRGAQQTREEAREATGRTGEHARAGMEKKSMFEGKNNFDIEGKISKVSETSITITREDLPAATLKVSKDTKVEVDGEKASTSQLRQGEDVKASFNLQDDKPVAVEIKAEKKKAEKRSGTSETPATRSR